MTTVSSEIPLPESLGERSSPPSSGLPVRAKVYYAAVAVATALAALPQIRHLDLHTHGWPTFLILASSAAFAQLFVVWTTKDQSYHTAIVFLVAACLLLPPELVALMGLVQHVPEWIKVRYAWYIQTFNIFNYTLSALGALGASRLIHHVVPAGKATWAVGGLVACLVFVAINHVLLATMLYLARGHHPRQTGLFSFEGISTDLVLCSLGVGVAAFWSWNPWLMAFVLAPMVLIHRSLHVPKLQEEARVDPKTGLFNARHFAATLTDELARAGRFQRPLSLIMADLDLLRDINNTYGHLAGDAVLTGIAGVFRKELRHFDIPARFGGEEFAILLPETTLTQALEIAERIRAAVAEQRYEVETSEEPIRATISMGVAAFPKDGADPNELVHNADLAVYRAKLQGRNRVMGSNAAEPMLAESPPQRPLVAPQPQPEPAVVAEPVHVPVPVRRLPAETESRTEQPQPRPHAAHAPRLLAISGHLALLVAAVGIGGAIAGTLGLVYGNSHDFIGMIAIVALVAIGQALAIAVDEGSISVSAVGALTGAALFGPRAALPLALAIAAVEWTTRRSPLHYVIFNVGTLSLASVAAGLVFQLAPKLPVHDLMTALFSLAAGAAYYAINIGLLSLVLGVEGRERWRHVWAERFLWLFTHYLGYGLIAAVMAIAYRSAGLYALAVAAVPLLLMRRTQAAYLAHTQRSAHKLRAAAETIQSQNVSLEQANRLLRERSTAAMESLSATVDARDAYTAGHSRRVQRLALALGRELNLSQPELDLLGHAALFHDIGKLAIPDSILLKPGPLTKEEREQMQRHAEEGARIIDRLGFLADAVPAIRHHHERFDGAGYPDRLEGDGIPLGARIIHVADALDSMLTTRIYRRSLAPSEALAELRRHSGTQFCPRCVAALERILPLEAPGADDRFELLIAS